MGPGQSNFAVYIYILFGFIGWASGQDYYEERHKYQLRTQMGHLTSIPKQFEVKGENALAIFNKNLLEIDELAAKQNLSVIYKVKVDTVIKNKHKTQHKSFVNKNKSKKYKVPLKKKNMKLSSFEMVLRKHANDVGLHQYSNDVTTTEKQKIIYTTKPMWAGKYKPIVGAVKTSYAKIVRPVRNRIITLET
ncbi:uncharacterized protein LOC116769224 [Danaus plexippus]|uniref:uncharacterized protein LOC116769224 n=1 Tax=Danaus plexippus TaxID=13037 RepID=UPI002AB1112C|nr:uncharacterized protein LOC116769224 [Danaus plexippus]